MTINQYLGFQSHENRFSSTRVRKKKRFEWKQICPLKFYPVKTTSFRILFDHFTLSSFNLNHLNSWPTLRGIIKLDKNSIQMEMGTAMAVGMGMVREGTKKGGQNGFLKIRNLAKFEKIDFQQFSPLSFGCCRMLHNRRTLWSSRWTRCFDGWWFFGSHIVLKGWLRSQVNDEQWAMSNPKQHPRIKANRLKMFCVTSH